jgi:hypothetical protein
VKTCYIAARPVLDRKELRAISHPILKRLCSELRYRVEYPTAYQLDLIKVGFRRIRNINGETIRFLIASDGLAATSEAQLHPFRRFAAVLRTRLGVIFHFMRLADAMRLNQRALARFHVIGFKLFFQTKDPGRIAAHFRNVASQTGSKLVYFDGDDDVCVQWPEVLRNVDLYVKKGIFADQNNYLRSYVGKSNLTEYTAREYGIAPRSVDIPSSGVLEPDDLAKLHLGWSTALDDKHIDLTEVMNRCTKPSTKDIDVLCRASLPQDWSFPLRNVVNLRVKPLTASRRTVISVPTSRVPDKQYYDELLRTRICISPFGYGEVCGRDIEAAICGCLLVKPDMSHIRSYPDIYMPGVTYVPVRWDYTDLVEVCERYLDTEKERARIAANACKAITEGSSAETFVTRFSGLLARLGLTPGHPTTPATFNGSSARPME